jgi:hypothetical protein
LYTFFGISASQHLLLQILSNAFLFSFFQSYNFKMGVNPQNMGKVKRYESKCKQYAGHIQKHTVSNEKRADYRAGQKTNASSDIIEDLQMLPDQEYESPDSLMQAMESVSQRTGQG